MKKLFYQIKPPCAKCPYTQGTVYTLANPCPQCKKNAYQSYERFRKQMAGEHSDFKREKISPKRS